MASYDHDVKAPMSFQPMEASSRTASPSRQTPAPTTTTGDFVPRNRISSQHGHLSQSSEEFYSTTTEQLGDLELEPSSTTRSRAGSMLDRGRPKPVVRSSLSDAVPSRSSSDWQRGGEESRPSSEWVRAEDGPYQQGEGGRGGGEGGHGRTSSFVGLPQAQSAPTDNAYSEYQRESAGGGGGGGGMYVQSDEGPSHHEGRPSSFYGLEGYPTPPQTSSESSPYHAPPSVKNFHHHQTTDSASGSSFSHEGHKNTARYHNAPYAASRAASLYGISSSASVMEPPTPSGPLLDHSHLQPGILASLLSHEKTLDLYRANAKKTNDPDIQFEFCTFVMEVVGEMESAGGLLDESLATEQERAASKTKQAELVGESVALLNKLATRGHVKSQYFLADCYTQGVGTVKGKRDYDKAFPLFMLAGKHGHSDACFRAAQCCENGWGCKKDSSKAVTFLRRAAALTHPGAMHRLGLAEINGEIGLTKRPREGVKWLKRAAEIADQVDPPQPESLHELAILHEKGIENIVFKDEEYAAELLARAAELQFAPSAFKLGECYEYGRMGCPQDSALSIHYYNIAAQQNHREACFALTAWYLVGSPGVLPQSDTEAYLWARKAADLELPKAEYAVGYFTEVGIGTPKDVRESLDWFRKAAEHGDKRAKDRLRLASSSQHFSRYDNPPAANAQAQRNVQAYPRDTDSSQAQYSRPEAEQPYSSPSIPAPSDPVRYRPPPTASSSRTTRRLAKEAPGPQRPRSADRTPQDFRTSSQPWTGAPPKPPPTRRQRSHSQPDAVPYSSFEFAQQQHVSQPSQSLSQQSQGQFQQPQAQQYRAASPPPEPSQPMYRPFAQQSQSESSGSQSYQASRQESIPQPYQASPQSHQPPQQQHMLRQNQTPPQEAQYQAQDYYGADQQQQQPQYAPVPYSEPNRGSYYAEPSQFSPLSPDNDPYGAFDQSAARPMHETYGRPAPRERMQSNQSSGSRGMNGEQQQQFRPLSSGQARMPARQQSTPSPVGNSNGNGRERASESDRAAHRERVLQRGKKGGAGGADDKDCSIM